MPTTTAAPAAKWNDFNRAVAEMCVRVPVSAGPAGLARELARIAPALSFRAVLVRGGWYRLGGIVDAAGDHVADDLEQWANAQFAAHGEDLPALAEAHAGSGLMATRLTGKTHYLVAATGPQAADFLQVEIEELQEVVCRPLFGDEAPASLEDLIDPPPGALAKAMAVPLGEPFFAWRRSTDVADFLGRLGAQKPEPQPVQRFFDAWQASSAGLATQISNHWVLAVREHLDRYREAGYPMAWFFHMLTTKTVPHAVANAVIEDVQAGFGYLPERDVKVLKDWLHRPYGF